MMAQYPICAPTPAISAPSRLAWSPLVVALATAIIAFGIYQAVSFYEHQTVSFWLENALGGSPEGTFLENLRVREWLGNGGHPAFVVPAMAVGFVALSFVAIPQFVLISMCILAFGPVLGSGIAWIATMVSAWLGFHAGPLFCRALLPRVDSAMLERARSFVAKHGFWSALIVRLIPSGPFVLVNMVLGSSRLSVASFLFGTGIGIVPKTVLIALAGSGLAQVAQGQYQSTGAILAVIVLIWGLLTLLRQKLTMNADKTREIALGSLEIKRAASQKG